LQTYEEFNGYPLFQDVLSPVLRTWNRVNVVFNMKEFLKNDRMARNYVAQFPRIDQVAIGLMCMKIQKDGYENTRREIMRKY
jgi:regulation of enolase protein 1 (concanavalin A-like superfamily)